MMTFSISKLIHNGMFTFEIQREYLERKWKICFGHKCTSNGIYVIDHDKGNMYCVLLNIPHRYEVGS